MPIRFCGKGKEPQRKTRVDQFEFLGKKSVKTRIPFFFVRRSSSGHSEGVGESS